MTIQMMEPLIIDNFLPELYQKSIFDLLTGHELPWTFHQQSVSEYPLDKHYYTDQPIKEHIQFNHFFVRDDKILSDFYKYIVPLVAGYQAYSGGAALKMQRIKANLLMPQKGPTTHPPHTDGMRLVDGVYNCIGRKTLLYYVNDADGDTLLYNERFVGDPVGCVTKKYSVSPKRGRAVIFDSNQIHSASSPVTSDSRIIINCVFKSTPTSNSGRN